MEFCIVQWYRSYYHIDLALSGQFSLFIFLYHKYIQELSQHCFHHAATSHHSALNMLASQYRDIKMFLGKCCACWGDLTCYHMSVLLSAVHL